MKSRIPMVRAAPLLAALLLPVPGRAAEPVGPRTPVAVQLQSNESELYPHNKEICLATYQQMSEAPGVVLKLQTDVENFSHYLYSIQWNALPPEAPLVNRNGVIPLCFDRRNPRPQRLKAVIRAVSKSGLESRPFTMELGYYPKEYYSASGQRSPSWLIVHTTDLDLCGSSVADWILERPTAEDRAYARTRWARLLAPLHTDYERARAIARSLIKALRPHEGVPSDKMYFAPPFEQLKRAERGEDHVWCGNYADIFSAACNAMDIPVRKIDMQYVWSSRGQTSLEIAEGHRTTEVFDRDLNQWIWMDPTFRCWGARTHAGEPLNLADMVQALNDERRTRRLRIAEYDPVTGIEKIVSIARSKCGQDLYRFFRQDQHYQYLRNAQASGL